jgi:hypothetical protein
MNSKYVKDTCDKAMEIAGLSHTGLEAKEVIKDLINICEQVSSAVTASTSDGVDQRILQKRYDALKTESRDLQKKLEGIRETLTLKMTTVIKTLNTDAAHIPDGDVASRVKASIKQLVEIITKI